MWGSWRCACEALPDPGEGTVHGEPGAARDAGVIAAVAAVAAAARGVAGLRGDEPPTG